MPFLMALLDFKKIMAFVMKNWRECLVAAMAFLIWYQNFNDTRFFFGVETIPSLEMRLEGAENAVKICKAGNDTLSATIDKRNDEVKKWKGINNDLEDDIKNLQTAITGIRTETKIEVRTILKDETPKTCPAAIDYLRDGRKDLQWKN
jgi:hypothetical protein